MNKAEIIYFIVNWLNFAVGVVVPPFHHGNKIINRDLSYKNYTFREVFISKRRLPRLESLHLSLPKKFASRMVNVPSFRSLCLKLSGVRRSQVNSRLQRNLSLVWIIGSKDNTVATDGSSLDYIFKYLIILNHLQVSHRQKNDQLYK